MSFLYISTSVVLFLYSFICLLCLFLFYLCIGNCKLSSIHFLWPPSTLIFSIVTNYTITFAAVLICDFHPLCQFSIFWLFSKDDHLHFRSVMKYISCYYFSWNMWSFPTWTTWIAHAIQLDNKKQMHACLLWLFFTDMIYPPQLNLYFITVCSQTMTSSAVLLYAYTFSYRTSGSL